MKSQKVQLSKKVKTIAILVFSLTFVFVFWMATKDGISISKQTIKGTNSTVLDYFNSIAEEYGVSFYKITKKGDKNPDVYAYLRDFINLSDEQKTRFFLKVGWSITLSSGETLSLLNGLWPDFFVICYAHRYSIKNESYSSGCVELIDFSLSGTGKESTLYKLRVQNNSTQTTHTENTKTKTKTKCSTCNGTGLIRYYYGGSSIEAILDGQPDSTVKQCYKCNGTGYIYK